MMRFTLSGFTLVLHFFVYAVLGQITAVPYDPSPFATIGYITGATLNDPSDVLSGGTLTLGDVEIIIPRNLLVNTPSLTAVAWGEVFTPEGTLNLPLWPEISWEASIFANYINGQPVAGVVYIFQELGHLSEGFITAIDYEKGEMRMNGVFGDLTTGQRMVINDPVGRYGQVHGDWPLWTADTDNPSIAASTGFPVCLPRVDPAVALDPLCPDYNRPSDSAGRPITEFTFEAPPVQAGRPDPNLFVPLKVGDFLIYSGTVVPDANGDRLIAAYTIDANLGIYTTPGTQPAYLRISALQAGIDGNPAGEIAQTRVEGYSTDQTVTIQIFVVNVDPCTGETSERQWGTTVPRANGRKGQWRFRVDGDVGGLPPYTREVGARISRGAVATPNSILAGQFISPYPPDGYVWPELDVFGRPQIPHEFNLLNHLANGYGPWLGGIPGVPRLETGPIVGQLNPWPGVGNPGIVNCPVVDPLVPVANAGPDITVVSGQTVPLLGGVSNTNLTLDDVTFAWSQTAGSSVSITGADSHNASFIAPAVATVSLLQFKLDASSAAGSTSDSVAITVNPSAAVDAITLEEVSWKSGRGSGQLTVTASTNSLASTLFMSAANPAIDRIAMSSLGGGRFSIVVAIRPAPLSVTVSSSLGASVTTSNIDD